jgi:K+-transporting ATPase ATPase A chain
LTWKTYAIAVLIFNFSGLLLLYALQRFQGVLPPVMPGMQAMLKKF